MAGPHQNRGFSGGSGRNSKGAKKDQDELPTAYKGATDVWDRRMSYKVCGRLERCTVQESLQVLSSAKGKRVLDHFMGQEGADKPGDKELMKGIQHLRIDEIPEHLQALEKLIKRYESSAADMAKVSDFSGPIFTIILIHGWNKATFVLQLALLQNPGALLVDEVGNFVFSAMALSCHPLLEKLMDNFLCKKKTLEFVRSKNEGNKFALMALGWCVIFRAEWMSLKCPDLRQEIEQRKGKKTGCASQQPAPRPSSTDAAAKREKRGPKPHFNQKKI